MKWAGNKEIYVDIEGVIKFNNAHDLRAEPDGAGELCALIAWRHILAHLSLIGQDQARYDGAGYGNLSTRIGPFPGPRGRRRFVISGTQTGGYRCLGAEDFACIDAYNIAENRVVSHGPIQPSSESLTHAAVYDLSPRIRVVLHVHSPLLWTRAETLRIPQTKASVPYGTQDMAREVGRLYRETALSEKQIFSMAGHEDGVIVFGRNCDEAGRILLSYVGRAYEMLCMEDGALCLTKG